MQDKPIGKKVSVLRKQKGITQYELAELTNVTVRTIQRIESGESIPRNFTLKTLAAALDVPFSSFCIENEMPEPFVSNEVILSPGDEDESERHFLQVFCLSCYSYLVVPYVHFLIPGYLLKKRKVRSTFLLKTTRMILRQQIIWMVAFHLLLLAALAYNFLQASYGSKAYLLNYLVIVMVMYFLNAILIGLHLIKSTRPKAVSQPLRRATT